MEKLNIKAWFTFIDKNGSEVTGTVGWFKVDWDGSRNEVDYAYLFVQDYLDGYFPVDFEITYIIALTDAQSDRIQKGATDGKRV